MAVYSKPTKVPRWADADPPIAGAIEEPGERKKDKGWELGEKPPFSYFNWLHNLTGDWFKWLNERLDDGSTNDELKIINPASGNEAIHINNSGIIVRDNTTDLAVMSSGVTINKDLTIQNDLAVLGGLRVGFSGDPPDRVIELGDRNFAFDFSGTNPIIKFGSGGADRFEFDRPNNLLSMSIANYQELGIDNNGIHVRQGLDVGTNNTAPVSGSMRINNGIDIGFMTGTPQKNQLRVGDINFMLNLVNENEIEFKAQGSDNYIKWSRFIDNVNNGSFELYQKQRESIGVERRFKIRPYHPDGHYRGIAFEGDKAILAIGYDVDSPYMPYNIRGDTKGIVAIGSSRFNLRGNENSSRINFREDQIGGSAFRSRTSVYCSYGSNSNNLTWFDHDETWHRESKFHWLLGHGSANMELAIHAMFGATPSMSYSYAGLYTEHVGNRAELFAIDDLDNATQISPHDPNTGEWYLNSFSAKRNLTIKVWLERLVNAVEDLTGKKFMEIIEGNQTRNALSPPSNSQ